MYRCLFITLLFLFTMFFNNNCGNDPTQSNDKDTTVLYYTDGSNLYIIDIEEENITFIGDFDIIDTLDEKISALSFDSDGNLYGMIYGSNSTLYCIDLQTGIATSIGAIGFFVFEGGLCFDNNNMLLGVNSGSADDAKMFSIDVSTGQGIEIGPLPGEIRDINGMAFDVNKIYAIERKSNTFGIINPPTGSYSPIGDPGLVIGNVGGLSLNPIDNKIYAVFDTLPYLYTIDKETGLATIVTNLNLTKSYGLAFTPVEKCNNFKPDIKRNLFAKDKIIEQKIRIIDEEGGELVSDSY